VDELGEGGGVAALVAGNEEGGLEDAEIGGHELFL
jgi:hypothetical protein